MRVQLRAFFKYDSGRQLLPLPPNGYIHSLVKSVFLLRYGGNRSLDRKSTRLNSSHRRESRMPSSA